RQRGTTVPSPKFVSRRPGGGWGSLPPVHAPSTSPVGTRRSHELTVGRSGDAQKPRARGQRPPSPIAPTHRGRTCDSGREAPCARHLRHDRAGGRSVRLEGVLVVALQPGILLFLPE